ncbi:MAG TPA: glutamate-1-semialdehyde 2,1-aminomutase [Planctomycetota bacterium]|nr:glutamate-1-semialdehyde 2,1-aminomutase [Planctomycetota bacterium]
MENSRHLLERARRAIPGGVNSPVRAFSAVGGEPVFIQCARGATVLDADLVEYLDYVGSWGPMILGHANPVILEAIHAQLARGTSYGAPTELEVELAELISRALPSVEMVRLVSSGTEACMSALRLARAFTGRDDVVKFEGHYHGHADSLLVKAGSGAATFGQPSSAGVPADLAKHTLVARWNDLGSVEECLAKTKVAAVILEPFPGNMGVVPPRAGFLEGVRRVTEEKGTLLIYDEVMTGFRVAWEGAQGLQRIKPDLTCLGKVVGGGMPLAAFGGRRDIMEKLAPLGPCYQAGTLSGNPLAVAAGLAQLRELERLGKKAYADLEQRGAALERGLVGAAKEAGVPLAVKRQGSMITPFFLEGDVTSWDDAAKADTKKFARFFKGMLERRVLIPPSQWEAWFISLAHSPGDIERTVAAAAAALK